MLKYSTLNLESCAMYTRGSMLLHLEDALKEGYTKVSLRTVDTDVLVLAVATAQRLNITELWVAFGTGKNFRHLAAHEMANAQVLIDA